MFIYLFIKARTPKYGPLAWCRVHLSKIGHGIESYSLLLLTILSSVQTSLINKIWLWYCNNRYRVVQKKENKIIIFSWLFWSPFFGPPCTSIPHIKQYTSEILISPNNDHKICVIQYTDSQHIKHLYAHIISIHYHYPLPPNISFVLTTSLSMALTVVT